MHLTAAQGWLELGNHEEAFEELEQIDAPLRGHPDVLEANLVLLVALGQYGDGVTVSDTHHLARKLKGGGREGEEER